jgi:hypothetical protein
MAYIQGDALNQPTEPAGEYSEPMHVKGVVRYVTPDQQYYDTLGYIGSWSGLLTAAFAIWLLRRQNSN